MLTKLLRAFDRLTGRRTAPTLDMRQALATSVMAGSPRPEGATLDDAGIDLLRRARAHLPRPGGDPWAAQLGQDIDTYLRQRGRSLP